MSPAIQRTLTWLDSRALTRAIQIVAVASLVLSLFVGVRQYTLANCLATYSDRASAATTQRADANAATTTAIDKFLRTLVNAQNLPQAQRQPAAEMAIQDYLTSRSAADEQRKLNPIPAPPSETC